MTRDEHAQLIESIRNTESPIERNNALLELINDYKQVLNTVDTTNAKIQSLENENIEYAKLNNKMFLQLNAQQVESTQDTEIGGLNENEPPQKLSFDDLQFDD